MIFIDTGAFVARYIQKDQYNEKAIGFWNNLKEQNQKLYTSNFVLNEAFTILAGRAGYKFASERARNIYISEVIDIIRPVEEDERIAIDYFEKYSNLKVSFTDCISFTLIQRYRINRVFTFDKHFEIAGYKIYP